jgi:hypothetical protein
MQKQASVDSSLHQEEIPRLRSLRGGAGNRLDRSPRSRRSIAAQTLARLIEDLIESSRLQAGKVRLETDTIDLVAVVHDGRSRR